MGHAKLASRLAPSKVALLHVARKQLAMREEDYRAVLLNLTGCESTTELDEIGFDLIIGYMNEHGFQSTWTKRTFGKRIGMARPLQVELIRKLWIHYHGADEGGAALNAWLNKYHGVSALRFVDGDKASAVITGLKAMAKRPRH